MGNRLKIAKRALALIFVLILSINSFGAVVSDNDGSAFVTKAEFDSLKTTFDQNIENYENSLNNKIDGAIASYLAGLKKVNIVHLKSELNRTKEYAERNGSKENYFGKSWGAVGSAQTTGVLHYVMQSYYLSNLSRVTGFSSGLISISDDISAYYGSKRWQPYNSSGYCYTPGKYLYIRKENRNGSDTVFLHDEKIRNIYYRWCAEGNGYSNTGAMAWFGANYLTLTTPTTTDLRYAAEDATTHELRWADCVKDVSYTVTGNTPTSFRALGGSASVQSLSFTLQVRSNYVVDSESIVPGIGYGTNSLDKNVKCIDFDRIDYAYWDNSGTIGTNGYGTEDYNGVTGANDGKMCVRTCDDTTNVRTHNGDFYKYPIYTHKILTINANTFSNQAAASSATKNGMTYYTSGLPVVYCESAGRVTLRLIATPKNRNGTPVPAGTNWSGKLYFNDDRFVQGTTQSHIKDANGEYQTIGWNFSNTNPEQTFEFFVDKDKEVWLKFVPDDSTSDDILVAFETVTNTITQYVET